MLLEFTPLTDASKSKGLSPHTKYYYVFFTATSTAHRSQGLCSTVIRHIQEISSRDNIPLWLEATTARSMRIYEKLGFETVDEMVLGKGKADQDGNACKGGDGVKIWGMVWWPKGLKEKAMLTRK
jgi:ribosomal protein S18 acetylase RimI-like enzyme